VAYLRYWPSRKLRKRSVVLIILETTSQGGALAGIGISTGCFSVLICSLIIRIKLRRWRQSCVAALGHGWSWPWPCASETVGCASEGYRRQAN